LAETVALLLELPVLVNCNMLTFVLDDVLFYDIMLHWLPLKLAAWCPLFCI